MKNRLYIVLIIISGMFLMSCEGEEENYNWRAGDNLLVVGARQIATLETETYNIGGYSIHDDLEWTLEGPDGSIEVTDNGEFAHIFTEAPGTYTLTVRKGQEVGTVTITATSVDQILGFADSTYTVTEGDILEIPVVISERNMSETSVSFTVVAGTAVEGVDYEVVTPSPLSFKAGQTDSLITINILSDLLKEVPNTFLVILDDIVSTGTGEYATALGVKDTVTVTIEDNLKYIAFEETEITELTDPNEAGNFVFHVTISAPAEADVIVPVTITGTGITPMTEELLFKKDGASTTQPFIISVSNAAFAAAQTVTLTLGTPVTVDEEVMLAVDDEENVVGNVITFEITPE